MFVARKAANPRNGDYFSLRVVNEVTGNSIEFARLRMEREGWNVWAADRDEQRILMDYVKRVGRKVDLKTALAAIRRGFADWNNEAGQVSA